MIGIKGEYEFHIIIQNMFNTYEFVEKNHNLVTDKGLELIFKCALGESDEHFGNIIVGDNITDPKPTDTYSTFTNPTTLETPSPSLENNMVMYELTVGGGDITKTCEIGIVGDADENPTLITRDVHDRYDIPPTAMITLKYMLMLKNIDNEEMEDEETIND